ncbi:MAG: sigma-70 family RNA polymerase sigma factor [bacterium]|nr:sigma-70 family RNA polymerase sigma factor [bacterium]
MKKSDDYLVRKSQEGDSRSFEMLVIKYQQRIFNVIFRIVRNRDDVEDLAQEAFLNAFRSIKGFRGGSSFYTWLYRIASNVSLNHLAKNKRAVFVDEAVMDTADVAEKTASADISPERRVSSNETASAISKAVESLPEEIKKAVILREYEGLSYEEIAELMDCPVGTVRSRIFRGRGILKTSLKGYL